MNNEQWKPIQGYEDRYLISNYGNVACIKSRVHRHEPREVGLEVCNTGYSRVQLSNPRKRFLVHRLVATHFCDAVEGCDVVNHLDNDRSNNYYENLEWTTTSGNLKHAQDQGRLYEAQAKGGKVCGAKALQNAIDTATSMIGSQYGDWTVTGMCTKSVGDIERVHCNCECKCGAVQDIYYSTLIQGKASKSCRQCNKTAEAKAYIRNIADELKGTVVNNWTFTGDIVGDPNTTKQLKLEVVCNSCGNTDSIPYSKMKTRIKSCKNCK